MKGNKPKSLTYFLNRLWKMQKDIWLVYRPTLNDHWNDRCKFLSKEYVPTKEYNHRTLLRDEFVIEFDDDSMAKNLRYAQDVATKLKKDNITYTIWYSGNKSYHVHWYIDTSSIKNISLFKRTVIKHYSEGVGGIPDMRLCSENHLIRAEYGIHEKTGKTKKLLTTSGPLLKYSRVPQEVYDKYVHYQKVSLSVRTTNYTANLENHKAFQFILQSEKFRLADDGRERGLFMLIHVLKNGKFKDNKEGLTKFLIEWYKYSGGYNLSEKQIVGKVNYHWNKKYHIGITYLRDLLESIGREDLLE